MIYITFGIIVLNGEPFISYNLRSLYSFAHQIIVVEGAVPSAALIASRDGHSKDGTLQTLHKFMSEEDPERKITLITAEDVGHPDGFWPGEKDEQSQIYANRATGNYLWQVDVDEFYKPSDIQKIIEMLSLDPGISAVSFKMLTFWGGIDYITDGWYLRSGANIYHRLFKWETGYTYVTHRPPTVETPTGVDLRKIKWIDGHALARKGIYLYHYSLLFPSQVKDKCSYYQNAEWVKRDSALVWYKNNYLNLRNPYRVHNVYTHPSWLELYKGDHPPEINKMWVDIENGINKASLRDNKDIEGLLSRFNYKVNIYLLKILGYLYNRLIKVKNRIKKYLTSILVGFSI